MINELVKELLLRRSYRDTVIASLSINYKFVDIETAVAKSSATAGTVYSYLSLALKEVNSWKFQRKIRLLLIENNIIKPVYHNGIVWFKGIEGLEADTIKSIKVLKQHYKDRAAYRNRQREYANKRYIKL